jgi:hypothetical protein
MVAQLLIIGRTDAVGPVMFAVNVGPRPEVGIPFNTSVIVRFTPAAIDCPGGQAYTTVTATAPGGVCWP